METFHHHTHPLLKPNKQLSDVTSSSDLTSSICKAMEYMVCKRLSWFLEANGLFHISQSAFRQR